MDDTLLGQRRAPPQVTSPANTIIRDAECPTTRPLYATALRLPWAEGDPWGAASTRGVAAFSERAQCFVGIVRANRGYAYMDEYRRSRTIFGHLLAAMPGGAGPGQG